MTEAIDGREILEVVERAKPELIVSDVMMPHVDGLEVCRLLKASANWRATPLILLSAKGSVDHRVEGLQMGADDYMAKPFSVAEHLQRLRSRVPWGVDEDSGSEGWCEKLEACISEKLTSPEFDVRELAETLGYSERQLLRRVMQHSGLKPSALILQKRLERAHELIESQCYETLAEVAYAVFLSPGYFSRRYRRVYGDYQI